MSPTERLLTLHSARKSIPFLLSRDITEQKTILPMQKNQKYYPKLFLNFARGKNEGTKGQIVNQKEDCRHSSDLFLHKK
jgi:hypothetical protein